MNYRLYVLLWDHVKVHFSYLHLAILNQGWPFHEANLGCCLGNQGGVSDFRFA